jgi:HAD superfamily hydrolase (TIGR01509 family)
VTAALPFDAVLFDVDGTLIDSNAAHAVAWATALREHGISKRAAEIRPFIGMGADKLLPAVAQLDEQTPLGHALAKRKKVIFETLLPTLVPTPGARALVEYLRDRQVELVIATSAPDREMDAVLERAGVKDLFHKRTSKDDAASSKPDPDIVEAALKKSRVPRDRTAMVGDTPYDVEAARRAGISAIALRCGGYWSDRDFAGALDVFDHPAALLEHWQ